MRVTVKVLRLLGGFEKIIGEVLRSLNVIQARADEVADFDALEIFNEVFGDKVLTQIKIVTDGRAKFFRTISVARRDERLGAEINRLVKKNLYVLLVDNFGLDTVPYGVLHGVRPTKIIQRWLDSGFGVTSHGVIDRDKISRRLCTDFLTDLDKATLLTEVATRQLPLLNRDAKIIGVYVGIPFCRTRCLYCSFPSFVLPADDKVAAFMKVLIRDIEAAADAIKRYGLKVQTIYIGGGTPTALPEKFFNEMLAKVFENFHTNDVEEFTVECGRPDTITAEKISALKKFRVTRVSVNPQTMQQRTLNLIGRAHTVEDVTRAFNELRNSGDWTINTDLILGLPGETFADFADSLSKVLALKPDDITLHALAIKRGSTIQKLLSDEISTLEDFRLPVDAEVQKMSTFADKVLRTKNYLPYYLYRQSSMSGQIENVGWCRKGGAGLYNVQIIGERQTILGIGSAASTKVPDRKEIFLHTAFNAKDLTTYMRDLDRYIAGREAALAAVYQPVTEPQNIAGREH